MAGVRLEKAIERFLTLSYGSGYGSGDGYGSGYGYGSGSGYGSGYGYGYGYGYGDGSGDGSGLKSFNGKKVYYIDGIPTVIEKVHRNLAKGFTINTDLTISECFIAKGENKFAHGESSAKAIKALQDKIFESMDTEEKIAAFLKEFQPDVKYKARLFYEWHHKLTGSCEFGRNSFIKAHGIDLEEEYTVKEFIEYTKNDFGKEIIRKLAEAYQ